MQTLDTAADGTYAFQHLKDGKYTVKVVRSSAIKDYDQTEDPDATIDDTSAVYTMGPENSLQEKRQLRLRARLLNRRSRLPRRRQVRLLHRR